MEWKTRPGDSAIHTHHSVPRPSPLPLESRPELCPAAADAKLDGRLDAMAQYYAAENARNENAVGIYRRLGKKKNRGHFEGEVIVCSGMRIECVARLGSLQRGLQLLDEGRKAPGRSGMKSKTDVANVLRLPEDSRLENKTLKCR